MKIGHLLQQEQARRDARTHLFNEGFRPTIARLMSMMQPACEGLADGQARHEFELVWYAELFPEKTEEWLSRAAVIEDQVQWSFRAPDVHNHEKIPTKEKTLQVRVRRTRSVGTGLIEYVLTGKGRMAGVKTTTPFEVELTATESMFMLFAMAAENGMAKRRYTFPIPGTQLSWEIDRFFKNALAAELPVDQITSDHFHPWVKIDLEHPAEFSLSDVPTFPFPFKEVVDEQSPDTPLETKLRIRQMYTDYFLAKNPYRD